MARPRKFFTVFHNGQITAIVEGLAAARAIPRDSFTAYLPFPSRLAAEEFAAWHEYMWWKRLNTTGGTAS